MQIRERILCAEEEEEEALPPADDKTTTSEMSEASSSGDAPFDAAWEVYYDLGVTINFGKVCLGECFGSWGVIGQLDEY